MGLVIQNVVFFIPSQNVTSSLDFHDADMVSLSLFQLKLLILVSLSPSEKLRQVHSRILHCFFCIILWAIVPYFANIDR